MKSVNYLQDLTKIVLDNHFLVVYNEKYVLQLVKSCLKHNAQIKKIINLFYTNKSNFYCIILINRNWIFIIKISFYYNCFRFGY